MSDLSPAHLAALGRSRLRSSLIGKVDLSGVIQETLLDAHAAGPADPGPRKAWLTTVFRHNLTDAIRHATADCRDARRDVPLDTPAGTRAAGLLPGHGSTPSARASRADEAARLARALADLPVDQRRAVELRYLDGTSVEGVATAMEKTEGAVTGLLKRGLRALRERLAAPPGG